MVADKLEKIITGLECCTQHGDMCGTNCRGHWEWTEDHKKIVCVGNYRERCSYSDCETGCVITLAKDALAVIKTQKPVEPIVGETFLSRNYGNFYANYYCGNCHSLLHTVLDKDNYCSKCGRKVKWDEH